jgi:hypothetical protein
MVGWALALPLVAGIACSTSSTQAPRTAGGTSTTPGGPPAATADTGEPSSTGAKSHPADQMIVGTISGISAQSLTVEAADGSSRTLQLAPETSVQVNGHDATPGDLHEGQPVRASFSTAAGGDVAIAVQAGGQDANDVGLTPSEPK